MACAKLSGQNIPCAARTYEKCALISNYNSSVYEAKTLEFNTRLIQNYSIF